MRGTLPDAPFKKTWPMLAVKRMVRYAAENGFDSIAWTTGIMQVQRYEDAARAVVDHIAVAPLESSSGITYALTAKKNDQVVLQKTVANEDELAEIIGKGMAAKVMADLKDPRTPPPAILEGADLTVGGEGMKGFYDQILPAEVNKFFGKAVWGKPKVGTIEIENTNLELRLFKDGPNWNVIEQAITGNSSYDNRIGQFKSEAEAQSFMNNWTPLIPVHALTVTPEMKSKSLREGLPLFSIISQQPSGRAVSADIAQNRSFANKLFEMRDAAQLRIQTMGQALQEKVQALAGPASRKKFYIGLGYSKTLKRSRASDDLDRAMMIYRDLKINPDKADEFKRWSESAARDPGVSERRKLELKKQLAVLDQAMNLSDEQKAFADYMGELFEDAYGLAKAGKIIQTHRDHYVRRLWKFPEGERVQGFGSGYGFKTYTTAAMERKLDTILDGWMAGYELSVQGITGSYTRYVEDLATVMANRAFIQRGLHTMDAGGNALFSARKKSGYVPLKASGFSVWRWAGQASAEAQLPDEEALVVTTYGRKFFGTIPQRFPEQWAVYGSAGATRAQRLFDDEEAARTWARQKGFTRIENRAARDVSEFFEKQPLYAPAPLAEMINKMTATDALFHATPGADTLLRFNAGLKGWILMSSFFHHLAGARSWVFGVHHGWKDVNPVTAYKRGLDKINDLHPLVELGVKNGLTLGELQDWAEHELRQNQGFTERVVKHFGLSTAAKVVETGKFYRERWADSLFKKFFAGLKAEAFVVEYAHELNKANEKFSNGRGPAPDPDVIAEKVARLINADFGGLHLQRMGRNPTLQKVARLLLLAPDWTESNFRTVSGMIPGLNARIGNLIGDVPPPAGMDQIFRKFQGRVMLRIAVGTIIAQLLLNGKDDSEEMLNEQMLSNQFNRFRWTEIDISKFYRLMGMDTDVRKTFSLGGHFFDPFKLLNPPRLIKGKGSPLTRIAGALMSGSDWAERPFTGTGELIKTGKTVKKSPHQETESFFDRLPATVFNQVLNMQPIQVGHYLRYLQGEEDALTALMHSIGAATHSAWQPRIETPVVKTGKTDAAFAAIEDLRKSGDLKLGPPSRHLTIAGVSRPMERAQYERYMTESSAIVARKMDALMGHSRWQKMDAAARADISEAIIKNARKRIRGKIKREMAKKQAEGQ